MGHRMYSRHSNGRLRRATLENTFGLTVDICPECRIMNPREVGHAPAEHCHACSAVLHPESTCSHCHEHITLISDRWTADDGTTACTDTTAPYVAHKPEEAP